MHFSSITWFPAKFCLSALLVLTLLCSHAGAQGQQGFSYREVQACSQDKEANRTADAIKVKKRDAVQIVLIETVLNCSARIKVSVDYAQPVSTSIRVDEEFTPNEPAVRCNCMRKIEVTLTDKLRRGSHIYLVKRGVVGARTRAA